MTDEKRPSPLVPDEGDNDYRLIPDETGADVWILVGNISVCIHRTDEGVVVDLWAQSEGREGDDPLASTYAFFQEAEEDE